MIDNNPRFTLNCLRQSGIAIPNINELFINQIDSPLLRHANVLRLGSGENSVERIKSIDDNIFLKNKPNRVDRGAIWVDNVDNSCIWWIVAAGKRKEGSNSDFYKNLEDSSKRKLKSIRQEDSKYKLGKSTSTDHLLPSEEDYNRMNHENEYKNLVYLVGNIKSTYEQSCLHKDIPFTLKVNDSFIEITTTEEESTNDTYLVLSFDKNASNADLKFVVAVLKPDDWSYCTVKASGEKLDATKESCIFLIKSK